MTVRVVILFQQRKMKMLVATYYTVCQKLPDCNIPGGLSARNAKKDHMILLVKITIRATTRSIIEVIYMTFRSCYPGDTRIFFFHYPGKHIPVNVTFRASPYTPVITFWTVTVNSPHLNSPCLKRRKTLSKSGFISTI
jgi:hypothetical protein